MNKQDQDIDEVYVGELQKIFAANTYLQKEKKVFPSRELVQSTLENISKPIPSPFSWTVVFSHKKSFVAAALVLVLIAGGVGVAEHVGIRLSPNSNTLSINAGDTSDMALSSDAAAIDNQLSGLNSDNASTDQGLNSQ